MATYNGSASSDQDLNQQPNENQWKGGGDHDKKYHDRTFVNSQRHNSGKQKTEVQDKPLDRGTQNRRSNRGRKQEPSHKNLNNSEPSDQAKNENTKKPPCPKNTKYRPENQKGAGTSEPLKGENAKNKPENQKGAGTSEPLKVENAKNKPENQKGTGTSEPLKGGTARNRPENRKGTGTSEPLKGENAKNKPENRKGTGTSEPLKGGTAKNKPENQKGTGTSEPLKGGTARNRPENRKGAGTSEPLKSENAKNKHENQKGTGTSEPLKSENAKNKAENKKGTGTSEPLKSENAKNKAENQKGTGTSEPLKGGNAKNRPENQKGTGTSEPLKSENAKNKTGKEKQRNARASEVLNSDKSLAPDATEDPPANEKGERISVMSAARKLTKHRNKVTQTEILGLVFTCETELPMEFQEQNQVTSEKWEELMNKHKKTVHEGMEKSKPAKSTQETHKMTEPRRNTGNNEINDMDFYGLQKLRQDVEKEVKDFWGPLEDVEPLQIKMGQILKAFSKKFPTECVKSLEAASMLLQQRTPMIESASGGLDDSSDSDTEQRQAGGAKVRVMEIGMQALELYKDLSLATSRDHSKLLSLQLKFTKCQTKLDALTGLTPGDSSVVNIHVLCNDALNVLDGLLDLNQKFHSVLSISKPSE